MIIREIQIKDAKQFLELTKITDAETPYLYFEENERKTTHKEQIENIKDGIKRGIFLWLLKKTRNL
ncbi:MAG: hypothetical protein HON40_00580 [Flavobacteriales bacterium]|nr:hypothetical protein [Flavobacteriales bacterium]